eukprot:14764024-Ditylum_brightwellii.AAC.1
MMTDGGANGLIFNDLSLLASYIPNKYAVKHVSGDPASCLGWGIVFIETHNSSYPIIPLWPSYYMPKNP